MEVFPFGERHGKLCVLSLSQCGRKIELMEMREYLEVIWFRHLLPKHRLDV